MAIDAALIDAYRHVGRQARAAQAHDDYVSDRHGELVAMWQRNPATPIKPFWAYGDQPVPLREDVVAYVNETRGEPDAVIGRALTCPLVLRDLVDRYALERAEVEANRMLWED